jgi:hypothetical protein
MSFTHSDFPLKRVKRSKCSVAGGGSVLLCKKKRPFQRAGSLTTAASEVAKCNLDQVGVAKIFLWTEENIWT